MQIIKFGASWCAPCKALDLSFEQLSDEVKSSFTLVKYDVDQNHDFAMHYKIRSVPTLLLFSDSFSEPIRTTGFMTAKQLEDFIRKHQ